ncbi:MAG: c-type cytochrome [Thermodesulfovibrionales bacterium]
MRKAYIVLSILAIVAFAFAAAGTAKGTGKTGEALFKQHCSPCHPEGGNNVNPQKTLHKKDREANGVKKASDIMGKMRNPGPGMTTFDIKTIPDKDAKEIAKYILKTFK